MSCFYCLNAVKWILTAQKVIKIWIPIYFYEYEFEILFRFWYCTEYRIIQILDKDLNLVLDLLNSNSFVQFFDIFHCLSCPNVLLGWEFREAMTTLYHNLKDFFTDFIIAEITMKWKCAHLAILGNNQIMNWGTLIEKYLK